MCATEHLHGSHDENALCQCSYGSWYPRYAALTPASRVIELDQTMTDFLHEDGLVLHEESEAVSRLSSKVICSQLLHTMIMMC
jgi:hypothetical protein